MQRKETGEIYNKMLTVLPLVLKKKKKKGAFYFLFATLMYFPKFYNEQK